MIRFVCICGHRLEVADDLAGDRLQCPKCGLLTDVPTLSDLTSFTDEGTYRMDAGGPVATDPDRMADLGSSTRKTSSTPRATRSTCARSPPDDGCRRPTTSTKTTTTAASSSSSRSAPSSRTSPRPKYDPETGELIRPIEVRNDPEPADVNPASIPIAKPAISYAGGDLSQADQPADGAGRAAHAGEPRRDVSSSSSPTLFNAVVFIAAAGLFFLWPVVLILQGLILVPLRQRHRRHRPKRHRRPPPPAPQPRPVRRHVVPLRRRCSAGS